MRAPAVVLAWIALAALAAGVAASGCNDLSSSCELQITCTPVTPPPVCTGIFDPQGTCDACVQTSCCQEAADCKSNGTCLNFCLGGYWPPAKGCADETVKAVTDALTTCLSTTCSPGCDALDSCDPVLATGCGPNASCETFVPGVFGCLFPLSPTLAKVCEACDLINDPICAPGMHCFPVGPGMSQCARYCCADTDCGTGKCVVDQTMAFGAPLLNQTHVGICLTQDGASPACDAPAVSPSKGSCTAAMPTP
ncbi:MAG: hypothetical protein ABJE95_37295 [Byssovorax sp.]